MESQLINTRDLRVVRNGTGIAGRVGVLYITKETGAIYSWNVRKGVMEPLSAPRAPAFSADNFRNAGMRGMHTDNIVAGNPRAADYMELFSRSRSNISRRFAILTAPALGQPYALTEQFYQTLDQDLAAYAAVGCQLNILLEPSSTELASHAQSSQFWAFDAAGVRARAEHVAAIGAFCLRMAGDDRIAAVSFLNEPWHPTLATSSVFTEQCNSHQEDCIDAVQAADPTRVSMVTCAWFAAPGGYTQMRPMRQSNVVYEVHFYQPYEITHSNVAGQQAYTGLYPSTDQRPIDLGSGLGITTGGAIANRGRMESLDLAPVIAFAQQYDVPIFVGEFTCGMMNGPGIACRWIDDAISVFEQYGFSWNQFGFWFPSNPWTCFELPNSTQLIDFNNGTTSGQAALSTFTGGSTEGRTPFAVVTKALRDNKLFRTAPRRPPPGLYLRESFEGPITVLANTPVVSAGMTAVSNSTLFPFSGTRHALFTHVSGAGPLNAMYLLGDLGVGRDFKEYAIEARVRLGAAITAGRTIRLFEANTDGGGSGAYWTLSNVAGTNTWQVEIWKGSGDFGGRPFINVTGLTFPVGVYVKVRVSIKQSPILGRIRVWMNDELLIDVNTLPTVTSDADRIWRCLYGLGQSNQIGQQLAFDDIAWEGV